MVKEFDIYNPYSNNDVTKHYISIIEKSLNKINISVNRVNEIVHVSEKKGIIVITPLDVKKAKKAGYKEVVCWSQGIVPEESYMRNKSFIRKHILSFLEKRGLKKSDFVFLVSNSMKKFYEKKYKIVFDNYYIMPCYSSVFPSSFEDRKIEKSFLYCGGLDEWQCFEETVKTYSLIEKKINSVFYVLVRDKEQAKRILEKYNVINYYIDYLSGDDYNNLLKRMKYGFCIRKDDSVNNVSTPTKLSSYVCNGVIPIVSRFIDDFYDVSKKSKYVVFTDNEDVEKDIDRIFNDKIDMSDLFADFSNCYKDYYNDDYYIDKISRIFEVKYGK